MVELKYGMAGLQLGERRFICLPYEHCLKFYSLFDWLYFTLRDIFVNGTDKVAYKADEYSNIISDGIYYEDRTEDYTYSRILSNSTFTSDLLNWLNSITQSDFEFPHGKMDHAQEWDAMEIPEKDKPKAFSKLYIEFDVWWKHFNEHKDEFETYCKGFKNKRRRV